MKYKTSELTGDLLDAAVAKAMGWEALPDGTWRDHANTRYVDGGASTDWNVGGPIIERERIALMESCGLWDAAVNGCCDTEGSIMSWRATDHAACGEAEDAPTPLVAAMRAFVKAKLGKEVDL